MHMPKSFTTQVDCPACYVQGYKHDAEMYFLLFEWSELDGK